VDWDWDRRREGERIESLRRGMRESEREENTSDPI